MNGVTRQDGTSQKIVGRRRDAVEMEYRNNFSLVQKRRPEGGKKL